MKIMKKTFILALAVVLVLAATIVPASAAYEPVGVTGSPIQADGKSTVNHRLTLTETGNSYLAYTIKYTFTVGDASVEFPTGTTNTSSMVTGKPTISEVTYPAGSTFTLTDDEGKYYKENALTVNWSGVTIKQPGIYTWNVSETVTNDSPQDASAQLQNGIIKAWVTQDGDELKLGGWFFLNASVKGDIHDTYPATKADLSVSKTVQGELASKEEYFKMTINLTTPAGAAEKNYNITGYDPAATVNSSGYNTGAIQPTGAITLKGGEAGQFDVWIKHGQTVKIADLPYGTTYTIVEPEHAHYRANGEIKNAKSLTADITENITNISEETAPTGITLQSAVPALGIAMAFMMLILSVLGKRRRDE